MSFARVPMISTRTIKIVAACLFLALVFLYAAVFVVKGKQDCRYGDYFDTTLPCASPISLKLVDGFFVSALICFMLTWILPVQFREKQVQLLGVTPQDQDTTTDTGRLKVVS